MLPSLVLSASLLFSVSVFILSASFSFLSPLLILTLSCLDCFPFSIFNLLPLLVLLLDPFLQLLQFHFLSLFIALGNPLQSLLLLRFEVKCLAQLVVLSHPKRLFQFFHFSLFRKCLLVRIFSVNQSSCLL